MTAAGLAFACLSAAPVSAAEVHPAWGAGGRVSFTLAAPPSSPCGPIGFFLSLSPPGPMAVYRPLDPRAAAEVPVIRPKKKASRAWIELAVFSAATTVNYWTSNSFPEDRDFKLTLDDQVRRVFFLDGWRFDSNQFFLNWFHVLAGAVYYQFGRTNRMSCLYSWMLAMAGSTWWEVIGEPKEVIALNDQLTTGFGGMALGEPWYQIGHFLCHQPGFLPKVLSFLNPVVKLNDWLDRKDPAAKGYVQPGWHDVSLFVGARRLSWAGAPSQTDIYFGFHARLLGLPEYGRPGEVRRTIKDTYWSEMAVDYAVRNGHAEEMRWYAKAVPWGRFVQKIGDDGRGYSLTLGLGSAFELFKKRPLADYDAHPVPVKTDLTRLHLEEPRNFTDKLAIVHIAGPVLDWTAFRRDLRLRTVVEAYFDFALVNAAALNDYSRVHDIAGLQTIVFYYGYYYGFGGTVAASARLDYRGLQARGLAEFGAWGSADALHRFQTEFTNNAHLTDTRTRCLFGLGWKVPRTPLELFADLEGVRRWGRLEEIRTHRLETKVYAGLAVSF
jgi:hypothetical protein